MSIEPLLCEPQYMERIWGGRALRRLLDRDLPGDALIGESWEVSDVPGSPTQFANPSAGTLRQTASAHGDALLGSTGYPLSDGSRRFPLLVKYLDADDLLSVQVHPGDDYAARNEGGSPGKSEMWIVIHAEPGAEIIAGLSPGVDRDAFAAAIRDGEVSEALRRVPVWTGDTVLMPAGRIHALGAGLVVLEIQQTSDVTYRLHDWGRLGADGHPRELHVEKGLEVIDFADRAEPVLEPVARTEDWGERQLLAVTRYFLTERWQAGAPVAGEMPSGSPHILMPVSCAVDIRWKSGELNVPAGRTAIVPASLSSYNVVPDGEGMIVRSLVPGPGLGQWEPRDERERGAIRRVCDRDAAGVLVPVQD